MCLASRPYLYRELVSTSRIEHGDIAWRVQVQQFSTTEHEVEVVAAVEMNIGSAHAPGLVVLGPWLCRTKVGCVKALVDR